MQRGKTQQHAGRQRTPTGPGLKHARKLAGVEGIDAKSRAVGIATAKNVGVAVIHLNGAGTKRQRQCSLRDACAQRVGASLYPEAKVI